MSIKHIIFDFDGTLVDTAPLIVATMRATIKELGLPEKSEAECRATIGIRLEDVPSVAWPGSCISGAEYARVYRQTFNRLRWHFDAGCFPHVLDTLALLHRKGFDMAIASSRSRKSLTDYVAQFNLGSYFSMLVGGDDVTKGKPSPEPVLTILNANGWRAADTLVVGDADVDIMMGKAAGTKTCAVTYGNGTLAELTAAAPDHLAASFSDLQKIIIS